VEASTARKKIPSPNAARRGESRASHHRPIYGTFKHASDLQEIKRLVEASVPWSI